MLKLGSRRQPSGSPEVPALPAVLAVPQLIDPETGLATRAEFTKLLQRDVARGFRYASQMAIVAFNVTVVGFETAGREQEAPSPAITVADALRAGVRETDLVGRVDEFRFVALLAECTETNAQQFGERLRTRLSSRPFTCDASGKGIYMRVWAASLGWTPECDTAEAYLAAALEKMQDTQCQMGTEHTWYKGDS